MPLKSGRPPVTSFVALGANLGRPVQAIADALACIAKLPGTHLVRHSSFYKSAPVQAQGPDFINAVVQIETALTAPELLAHLQGIEAAAGRERPYPNAPRTLDLDILLYGSAQVESERLTLPHPRMKQRAFVLVPLAEIAPGLVDPEDLRAVSTQPVTLLPR